MTKLNSVDIYLLDNWEDISIFLNGIENLNQKILKNINNIVSDLYQKSWAKKFQFGIGNDGKELWGQKNTWRVGNGEIAITVSSLSYEDLIGASKSSPDAYVYNSIKGKKHEIFNKHFQKHAEKITKSLKIPDDLIEKYPVYYKLKQKPQDWVNLIKENKFNTTIINVFDNLSKLIDPIDRALKNI